MGKGKIGSKRWKIEDLVDLEFFISRDRNTASSILHHRDRGIFLNNISPETDHVDLSKKDIIRLWLSEQRKALIRGRGDTLLPGQALSEAYGLLSVILIVLGLFSGIGLAYSLLRYNGLEPVNVSIYFGVLVIPQVVFLLLLVRFMFVGLKPSRLKNCSGLTVVLGALLSRLVKMFISGVRKTMDAGMISGMEAAVGLVKGRNIIYGPIFYWRLVALIQVFGISFNAGAVMLTMARVLSSDLAFGWQSTLQLNSDTVFRLVRIISAPWSWFVNHGYAHPSLEQIEGSRMILKDGMYHLMSSDLVSWWPFLVFCVAVYGLLPRILLYVIALASQYRAFPRLDFMQVSCAQLFERMTMPIVDIHGERDSVFHEDLQTGMTTSETGKRMCPGGRDAVALVHSDIMPRCERLRLQDETLRVLNWRIKESREIRGDVYDDRDLLDDLSSSISNAGVVLLVEAWQAPIEESLGYISAIRRSIGPKTGFAVLLIGRPSGDDIFTPVDKTDNQVWQRSLHKLGDPYLYIEAVGVGR